MTENVKLSAIHLRPAIPEDAENIAAQLCALAGYMRATDGFAASPETVRRDAFGDHPRIHFWIAERKSRPIGLLGAFETYSSFKAAPCLFVDSIYVAEDARGTGAGRALMTLAAREAIARGCIRLDLNVLDWNPARAAYEAVGLSLNGEVAYSIAGDALHRLAGLS